MAPEWGHDPKPEPRIGLPDYGANSEMSEVAHIVFDTASAEDATTRLHNRRPTVPYRRLAILVRRARQNRNAGRTAEMTAAVHEIAVLGTKSLPPQEHIGWTRAEVLLLLGAFLLAVLLVTGVFLWR